MEEYEQSEEFEQAQHAWRDEEEGQHNYDVDSDDESHDGHTPLGSMNSSLDERFHGLEEEVATLVADVHDLALYTKLNFTGFIKIIKVSVIRRLSLGQR